VQRSDFADKRSAALRHLMFFSIATNCLITIVEFFSSSCSRDWGRTGAYHGQDRIFSW
jgi:hypothetical protein